MAAVLAGGPAAALSHHSAGALWGMLRSSREVIDVTSRARRRTRSGIRLHRSHLPADEVTGVQGIPVTSPPRTLLDLAGVVNSHGLERAMEQAEARRITDHLSLADLLARHPSRPGVAALRRILAAGYGASTITRSALEDRFLAFLDARGLPRPRVNASIRAGGRWMECDFVWGSRRLIVELDGREYHDTSAAFERDRERDRALNAAGWRVVRVTWRHLRVDPNRLAADLRALLVLPG
jgi:REase_MTES_1575